MVLGGTLPIIVIGTEPGSVSRRAIPNTPNGLVGVTGVDLSVTSGDVKLQLLGLLAAEASCGREGQQRV